jgi:hypothetical protein
VGEQERLKSRSPGIAAQLNAIEDPVRLYMREIGQIELLDADDEFWLSSRMKAQDLVEVLEKQLEKNRPDGRNNPDAGVIDELFSIHHQAKRAGSQKQSQPMPELMLIAEETQNYAVPGRPMNLLTSVPILNVNFWTPGKKDRDTITHRSSGYTSVFTCFRWNLSENCWHILPKIRACPVNAFLKASCQPKRSCGKISRN